MATRQRHLELDEAMRQAGTRGKFQLRKLLLLFLVACFQGSRMTSNYFLTFDQGHRCKIPGLDNDTFAVHDPAHQVAYNRSIPPGDSCRVYNVTHSFDYDADNRPIGGENFTQPCPNRWVYDKTVMHWTATAELDLVCSRVEFQAYASTFLYVGSLVGSPLFGILSDRCGRRTSLLAAVLLYLCSGVPMGFCTNVWSLFACEFLTGASTTGMFGAALVMGLELVDTAWRKVPGLVIQMFFTVGELCLAGLAYGLKNWLWLDLCITAPAALLLLYYWLVPESPRWLMIHKHYRPLAQLLDQMALANGVHAPPMSVNDRAALLESYQSEPDEDKVTRHRDSFMDIFKSCILCLRTLILFWNWFAINMTFYVFVMNSAHMKAGNIYLDFVWGAVVEIPAHVLSLLLVGRIGRKGIHCAYLVLTVLASGAAVGVALRVQEQPEVLLFLAIVGKFSASGLMGTSFLWTTELFPTTLRSTGLGFSSSAARGAKMNSSVGQALPFAVVCGVCVLALAFDLGLPETNGRDLPQTVEEAKQFGRAELIPQTSADTAEEKERRPLLHDKDSMAYYDSLSGQGACNTSYDDLASKDIY